MRVIYYDYGCNGHNFFIKDHNMKFLRNPNLTRGDCFVAVLFSFAICLLSVMFIFPLTNIIDIGFGLICIFMYINIWDEYCNYRKKKTVNVDV